MSALDREIDDLYKLPLADFTRARNALAKTVRGADATHVRTLAKPTVVAWAANQVYWRARPAYDRLMKAGDRLRKAQIAALHGKAADLREANDAHRKTIADAVKAAERVAAEAGSHPAPDALMRTFEALSLAKEPPAPPGRLSEPLQPAGFEALAGVTPTIKVRLKPDTTDVRRSVRLQAASRLQADRRDVKRSVRLQADSRLQADRRDVKRSVRLQADPRLQADRHLQADEKKRRAEEKKRAAEERRQAAAIRKAEAAVARAKAKMRAAEEALRRTQGRS